MRRIAKSNPTETFESIKLGIDAHARWYSAGKNPFVTDPEPPFDCQEFAFYPDLQALHLRFATF
jgi:hypothetical protein